MGNIPSKEIPVRVKQVLGIEGKYGSQYDKTKYAFAIDSPFPISGRCCSVMKKAPAKAYAKKTGRYPMTGQQASESKLRTSEWVKDGCNGFYMKSPMSNPMAFWTEQDVLLYIKTRNIPIASVYGDIVVDYNGMNQCEGQMDISEFLSTDKELFDLDNPLLKTTGCSRTGCMFCGFGCHLEKEGEGRFERLKETHPRQYEYIMKPTSEGGLGYKEIIDWINEHGNMNIRY